MDEPNALIRWIMFLFAGGIAGIAGALTIAAVAMYCFFPFRRVSVRPFHVAAVVALASLLIICGSLPMPFSFQVVTLLWVLVILSRLRFRTRIALSSNDLPTISKASNSWLLFLCSLVWLITFVAIEVPFQLWSVPAEAVSTLLVIGDSVTAGLNDGDDTWPRQLARNAQIEVVDASQPGATIRTARQQNSLLSGRAGLVVIEIGGNDMLEGLPVERFEEDLNQLLTEIVQPRRSIVMFELPLPPLCASYGVAQRNQAGKHRVKLIPKRLFASVLTTKGATVDGIHLSDKGQTRMMALIQLLLDDRLRQGTGSYVHVDSRSMIQSSANEE